MPIYDRMNIPDTVGRGTLDPQLEKWLPPGRRWAPMCRSRRAAATIRNSASGHGRRSGRYTPSSCRDPTARSPYAVTRPRSSTAHRLGP